MIDLDKLILKLERSLYYGDELKLSITELEFMLNFYKSLNIQTTEQPQKRKILKKGCDK